MRGVPAGTRERIASPSPETGRENGLAKRIENTSGEAHLIFLALAISCPSR